MLINKVKTVAAMLLAVGLLAGGTGLVARSAVAPQETLAPALARAEPKDTPKEEKKKPLLTDGKERKVLPTDPALSRLQKELYNTALLQARLSLERFPRYTTEAAVLESIQMLYEAELALAEKQADRLAVMEKRLNSLVEIEKICEERYKESGAPGARNVFRHQDLLYSREKRLEVEIQLLKAKQKR
ncbi:MAG TPA: hypothetical protein VKD72_29780 [Gemmataceae bacterium]|nr:hypothetical protein [Gemmataceae bacterium]